MIHVANEILQTPTTTPCQRQRQSTVDPTPGSVARVRTKLMITGPWAKFVPQIRKIRRAWAIAVKNVPPITPR